MSETNKAKILAARRLFKERQMKKEKPAQPPALDSHSRKSSYDSTPTPEYSPGHGNSFSQSSNPQPFQTALNNTTQVNGTSHVVACPEIPQTWNVSQVPPYNSVSRGFDVVSTAAKATNDNAVVLTSNPAPTLNPYTMPEQTDSSCSISTKSEDDYASRESHMYSQDQTISVADNQEKVKLLEAKLRDMTHQQSQDLEPFKEKLNIQQRTIEILVSEKTELQKELAVITEDSKRNAEKNVEYSVKMKALKSEVARLQSEARDSIEARQQHNSILKKLEHSLNEANSSIEQYKRDIEVNYEEMEELKKLIRDRDQKSEEFKKSFEETTRRLSLAEMKLAQFGHTADDSLQVSSNNFEGECEKLREEVARMRREVSENTAQYKNYIETLNSQLHDVNIQYEACVREKNDLLAHKEGLTKQLGDMEKQIAKEKLTGPSLSESNVNLTQQLTSALETVEELKVQLDEKTKLHDELLAQLESTSGRLNDAELALERLEVPNTQLLQAAMESDRIAASRAIEQNSFLKQQLDELTSEMNHSIIKLNNEKLDLTEKLQHAEYLVREMEGKLLKYDHKEKITYTDSVSQCPMIFQRNFGTQTDINDVEIVVDPQHATPEAMLLLEKKLKKTMDQVAYLSDENQKLEHIVIQLQGETETIGEYVTLYQNQRGLLVEKIAEREKQAALLAQERKELRDKLLEITNLLPYTAETSDHIQGGSSGVSVTGNVTEKIKTLLTEIETSELMRNKVEIIPSTFHPCLLCSGKLITV